MAALVSIVIPVYNGERHIGGTLSSVLRQTYPNTEIICVDDGSRDGTAAILGRAAAVHANVIVAKQPNGGVAAARNRGISIARGEFVSFVDADDLWHPEKLAQEVDALEHSGPEFGVAYSLFRVIDLADEVIGGTRGNPSWQGDVSRVLMIYNIVGNCSAFTVRRCYLDRTPGFDPSLRARHAEGCEDWKLLCQLAAICKFVAVPLYLVGYRRHPAAMSKQFRLMKRSSDLVFEDLKRDGLKVPRHVERTRRGLQEFWWLRAATIDRAVTARELGSFFLALQSPRSAWLTIKWLSIAALQIARRRSRTRHDAVRFDQLRAEEGAPRWPLTSRHTVAGCARSP